MLDFQFQKCSRRCLATDEEFKPGDVFYSVLVDEQGELVRRDYAEAAWPGPPDDSLGWWQSRMPDPTSNRVDWAPSDVMIHYFEQLADTASRQDLRYVLALLMIRRRIVRLEDTEANEQGQAQMVLYCPKNEKEYRVTVVHPAQTRVEEIEQALAGMLFKGDA